MKSEIIKNVLLGAGVVAGLVVVGKAIKNKREYNEHELIGDCEVMSEEMEEAE